MSQLRKDPLSAAWVIISPERGLEASDFGSVKMLSQSCLLCPGHEEETGSELRALRHSSLPMNSPDWHIRVIEQPNAFLKPVPFEPEGSDLYCQAQTSGYQELIIEHPEHGMTLERMSREHLSNLLKLYADRLEALAAKAGVQHVQLIRNVGGAAGAIYEHPHAQLLAAPLMNRWLAEELAAAQSYRHKHGTCLFCDLIAAEFTSRERLISYNQDFVALAPYAARKPFEVWILPLTHSSRYGHIPSNALPSLADLLKSVLGAMNEALNAPPYNMILHTLPHGDGSFHWHLEILPRLSTQVGFDWGSGFYVNPTPPEDAARFLRQTLSMQGVSHDC